MSQISTVPYGRRLLPTVIDERARDGHARPFASIPLGRTAEDGYRDVSYRVFANAVNTCSAWLVDRLGSSEAPKTLAYLGPSDLRYQILAVSAAKTGHVVFFPSPRNSAANFNALFDEAEVTAVITDEGSLKIISNVVEERELRHFLVPALKDFLDSELVTSVQFTGDFDDYRMRPWLMLHTSGSTGLPKIVTIRHGLVTTIDAYSTLSVNEIQQRYGSMRIFVPFPPFHVAGLLYTLPVACWIDATVVLPPVAPLSVGLVDSVHVHGSVEYSMLPPSLLVDITKNQDYLRNLEKLKGVTFAGGPLPQETATIIQSRIALTSSLGATEYGAIPMLPKKPEDFAYFRFNEAAIGLVFEEVDHGLFEMVFVKKEEASLVQGIFVTFPELKKYRTKDCFSKHPTKPGLWKYESRIDDVIVFSNGEKFNPIGMEGMILSCPSVKGCLVVGQGRFHSALIVELADGESATDQLRQDLWPFVDQANRTVAKYGRIAAENIIFTSGSKPFPRAAKGTIQRGRANALYAAEIEDLYAKLDIVNNQMASNAMDLTSESTIRQSLRAFLMHELDLKVLQDNDDFFALGLDSLQVIGLVRKINASPGSSSLDQKHVYDNPTVETLCYVIKSETPAREYDDNDADYQESDKATWTSMEKLYLSLAADSRDPGSTKRPQLSIKSSRPPPIYPPDGGTTAWLQVLGTFLINMNNWGLVNSFGVYEAFYSEDMLSSHSRSAISWIGTLQAALLLIIGVGSGPLFDRGYFRPMLILASIGLVFSLMMLSLATEYYQVMLCQGILSGLCLGLLYIPSVALIPLYFKKHRGLALGLATSGGSFGGVLYPIIFRRLLGTLDFGWANRVIGFIVLITLTTAGFLVKPSGPRAARELIDLSAFRDLPYTMFTIAAIFLFAGVLVPFFLATIYAQQALHEDQDLAFYAIAVLNSAQLVGRILPALISDYIGPELMLLGAQVAAGLFAFCWIAVSSTAGYMVWLVFFGAASGMVVTLPAAVLPFVSPSLAVVGTRLGMLYAAAGLGILIGAPVATAIIDDSGSYIGAQAWVAGCCLVGAACYTVTARAAWTRRRMFESKHSNKKWSAMEEKKDWP